MIYIFFLYQLSFQRIMHNDISQAQLTQRGGKKKKKKKHVEGDSVEVEEEEEDGVDEEGILQQQQELDEERNRILNDQHMIEEVRETHIQV